MLPIEEQKRVRSTGVEDSKTEKVRDETNATDSMQKILTNWKTRIFVSVWITYACFYLTRVNFSIAIPGIMDEFGFSKTELGLVASSLFFAYAFGQFVNGQLGDKLKARRMLTIGILASAVLNIMFGFTSNFLAGMILLWGLNGYFQSMGWGPSVKTIANWFPIKERGKVSGRLGTSYIAGGAFSWALAGFIVGLLGWRFAFWIPAIICIGVGILWSIYGRNAPEEVGLPSVEEHDKKIVKRQIQEDKHIGFKESLKLVATSPFIWLVFFGLFCLNIVRYGFMTWAPTYMFEEQGATISMAAYKALVFPIAGILGAIFAGWVSDKYFQTRRAPVCVVMLLILALFCYLFYVIPGENWIVSLCCLLVIGFMTFGPHILMVGAFPMDLGTRKAASSVTGFIDCGGYIGAAITGVTTGWLVDNYGWQSAFYFWILGAIMAAILMAMLWNYKPIKGKYH